MRLEKQQWVIASLASGATAVVTLLLAVATAKWLLLTEFCTQTLPYGNLSIHLNYTLKSNFGLWRFCTSSAPNEEVHCLSLGFGDMGVNEQNRDDSWKSGSVVMATRVATPAILSAVVLTVFGFLLSILGNFKRDKRTIIAAVMYISSGFCLSFSVIMFISRINDELSLQPKQDCVDFKYEYGWSFNLVGLAFVMEETAAVISIKVFLMQNTKKLDDMVRIIPGLEDKITANTTLVKPELSLSQTMIW